MMPCFMVVAGDIAAVAILVFCATAICPQFTSRQNLFIVRYICAVTGQG